MDVFGGLFWSPASSRFIHPQRTFAALADTLGFLILVIGVWWIVEAFVERRAERPLVARAARRRLHHHPVRSGSSGQFLMDRVYLLLIYRRHLGADAGITDIVRAFGVRKLQQV